MASWAAAARSDPPEGIISVSSWPMTSKTALWSTVSGTISTGLPEKAITPTRSSGKASMSSEAMALAAVMRSGEPSRTCIEREVSMAMMTLREVTRSVVLISPR